MDRYKEQQDLPKCNETLQCRVRMMYPHWPLSKQAIDVHLVRTETSSARWILPA